MFKTTVLKETKKHLDRIRPDLLDLIADEVSTAVHAATDNLKVSLGEMPFWDRAWEIYAQQLNANPAKAASEALKARRAMFKVGTK